MSEPEKIIQHKYLNSANINFPKQYTIKCAKPEILPIIVIDSEVPR